MFVSPGPWCTVTTPTRPLTRAYPSAMQTALHSWRAWWKRAPPLHSALVTIRLPLPMTPNASCTPCEAIVVPTTSATDGAFVIERDPTEAQIRGVSPPLARGSLIDMSTERPTAGRQKPPPSQPVPNMLPGRRRRQFGLERVFTRVIATAGIVAVGVLLGAILASSNVQGWIIGLVVAIVSVVLSGVLWSSRQL